MKLTDSKTFPTVTDIRLRPSGDRVLLSSVTWAEHYGDPGSRTFTAPAGMVYDGASIPTRKVATVGTLSALAFLVVGNPAVYPVLILTAAITAALGVLNGSTIQLAATIHDAAYRLHTWDHPNHPGDIERRGDPMTWFEADRMLRNIAGVCQRRARRDCHPLLRCWLRCTHDVQRWLVWAGVATPFGYLAWRSSFGRALVDDRVVDERRRLLNVLDPGNNNS